MARIYAMALRSGSMTLADVPGKWREATLAEYVRLYGEEPR